MTNVFESVETATSVDLNIDDNRNLRSVNQMLEAEYNSHLARKKENEVEKTDKEKPNNEQPIQPVSLEEKRAQTIHNSTLNLMKNWDSVDTNDNSTIEKSELKSKGYKSLVENFDSITKLDNSIFGDDESISFTDLKFLNDLSYQTARDVRFHEKSKGYAEKNFEKMDANKDGEISPTEIGDFKKTTSNSEDRDLIDYLESRMTGNYEHSNSKFYHYYNSDKADISKLKLDDLQNTSLEERIGKTHEGIYRQYHSNLYKPLGEAAGAIVGFLGYGTVLAATGLTAAPAANTLLLPVLYGSMSLGGKIGNYFDYKSGINFYNQHQKSNLNKMFSVDDAS